MITDEMVEKALEAAWPGAGYNAMHAALEAVAPMLIAQGMREAAALCPYSYPDHVALLARAQELIRNERVRR